MPSLEQDDHPDEQNQPKSHHKYSVSPKRLRRWIDGRWQFVNRAFFVFFSESVSLTLDFKLHDMISFSKIIWYKFIPVVPIQTYSQLIDVEVRDVIRDLPVVLCVLGEFPLIPEYYSSDVVWRYRCYV